MAAPVTDVEASAIKNATAFIKPVWSRDPKEVPFDRAASFGLFVGIRTFGGGTSNYTVQCPTEIPYAVDDAIDLAYLFAQELELIDARRVKLLLGGEPNKPSSISALKWLTQNGATVSPPYYTTVHRALDELTQSQTSSQGGLLVVSFSTHGVYLDESGGDCLLCSDSTGNLLTKTTVALQDIISQISQAKAARRLALIDACRKRVFSADTKDHGDDQGEAQQRRDRLARAMTKATGTAVLSATGIGGVSFDDAKTQNGVFTGRLIAGLRGQAPHDERGFITVRNLAAWTNEAVKRWIETNQPQYLQTSAGLGKEFFGDNPEEIPLALNAAAMRTMAKKRRDVLFARVAKLYADDSVDTYKEILNALDHSPLQPAEKLSLDKLEQQLGIVEKVGSDAAESFILWWEQKGRALLPLAPAPQVPVPPPVWVESKPVIPNPRPPSKPWIWIGSIAAGVVAAVIGLVSRPAPDSDTHGQHAPMDFAEAVVVPELPALSLRVMTKPSGASVRIAGADGTFVCATPAPCSVTVAGAGPFNITVEKHHYLIWSQTADTREKLAQALDGTIDLTPEPPK